MDTGTPSAPASTRSRQWVSPLTVAANAGSSAVRTAGGPPAPVAQGLRLPAARAAGSLLGVWEAQGPSRRAPLGHLPWASSGSSLRFSEGSKVLWGFLSCFFCLFLDRTSTLPSSSSRARLLRAAPLSLFPSLGLKGNGSGQSWGHPVGAGPLGLQGLSLS